MHRCTRYLHFPSFAVRALSLCPYIDTFEAITLYRERTETDMNSHPRRQLSLPLLINFKHLKHLLSDYFSVFIPHFTKRLSVD